jgi:hypothetical protein
MIIIYSAILLPIHIYASIESQLLFSVVWRRLEHLLSGNAVSVVFAGIVEPARPSGGESGHCELDFLACVPTFALEL